MKNKILTFILLMSASISVFAQVEQISVNVNGETYACVGAGSATSPQVTKIYCECTNSFGIFFRRMAVMSDGTLKKLSSDQLTPSNRSYHPEEILEKCQKMVKECK